MGITELTRLALAWLFLTMCGSCSESEAGNNSRTWVNPSKSLVVAAAEAAVPTVDAITLPAGGRFDADDVPLGLDRKSFEIVVMTSCKLSSNAMAAPVLGPLTNYEPPIEEFFPAEGGARVGLSKAWGWVGALDSNQVEVLDMRCDGENASGFFLKSDGKLVAYSKMITVDGATIESVMNRVEEQLKEKCETPIRKHSAVANDRSLGRAEVLVRYCGMGSTLIAASTSQLLHIGTGYIVQLAYISGDGWLQYLASVRHERHEGDAVARRELADSL